MFFPSFLISFTFCSLFTSFRTAPIFGGDKLLDNSVGLYFQYSSEEACFGKGVNQLFVRSSLETKARILDSPNNWCITGLHLRLKLVYSIHRTTDICIHSRLKLVYSIHRTTDKCLVYSIHRTTDVCLHSRLKLVHSIHRNNRYISSLETKALIKKKKLISSHTCIRYMWCVNLTRRSRCNGSSSR